MYYGSFKKWDPAVGPNVCRHASKELGVRIQSSVQVASGRCRFAGMRFIGIDQENLAGRRDVPRSAVRIRLSAIFDKADDKVVVCVTRVLMCHELRVQSLNRIGFIEAIVSRPLAPNSTLHINHCDTLVIEASHFSLGSFESCEFAKFVR